MLQDIFQTISEVNVFYQYIAIFLFALFPLFEAYVAVPIGLLLGLPFIPTIILNILATWLSVMGIITILTFFRSKFFKRDHSHTDGFFHKRMRKARGYFNKYGVQGISLMGPVTVTNNIGALVSIVAGASKARVALWQTISIIIWAVGTGLLVMFGVDIYHWIM